MIFEIGKQVWNSDKTSSIKGKGIAKKLNTNFEGPIFIEAKISPTFYEMKKRVNH